MGRSFRLLMIEDRQADAELLIAELVRAGFSPDWQRVDNRAAVATALQAPPQLILCDYSLPGLDALDVLAMLRDVNAEVPLIVVSGQMDEETCVKSLQMGAVDYLLKDRLMRLGPAVERALDNRLLGIEKREAERKERASAGMLRGLVAHAPAGISVKAVDGRYLLTNRQFEQLCGLGPGRLIGHIDAEVFPAEQAREMTELDARCLHNSIVLEREEEFADGTGGIRNLLCVRYPVIDDDGQVFGIGAIYSDITRQKRVEAELRDARGQLQTRAEELAAGNAELREVDRVKSEFIASVSHDLRTPLTSIRGYLEMLTDQDADLGSELGQRFLAIIGRNSEHLLSLIEDLLILSKLDSGTAPPPAQDVSITDLVNDAAAMLQPALQQARMKLAVDLDEGLPIIRGNRDHLERVLVNLLSNAVKFSPAQSTIKVAVRNTGEELRLSVSDQGIGISVEDQQKLFTRFFRTEAARDRGIAGTGLGLSVVKGIVEGHGGRIEVESEPGRGTTFVAFLPVP